LTEELNLRRGKPYQYVIYHPIRSSQSGHPSRGRRNT